MVFVQITLHVNLQQILNNFPSYSRQGFEKRFNNARLVWDINKTGPSKRYIGLNVTCLKGQID